MGQKKNKRLLITIIILFIIIILIGGTMAYLYFFTDMFKSNKLLFFKYTAQVVQDENGFIEDNLLQYFQKKKNTSYENSGDISFEVSIPNLEKELELANNFNITFTGKADSNNEKAEKAISINYSDDVNFPLTYRKTKEMTGIQTKYVGSNFVAIRNDEKLSGHEELNRFSDLQNLEFSNEEAKNVKTTYFDNILNNLGDSKFSQVTEGELTGYKLTLTGEEFKNILIQILNSLKSDENTINKLNKILDIFNATEIDKTMIEDLIKDVNNDLEIKNNIEFTVYESGRKLTKVDIMIEGNIITINKEGNEQEISYTLSANDSEGNKKISFSVKYAGLNSDNINENYEIILDSVQRNNSIEESETTETEENSNSDSRDSTTHYEYIITNNVQFKSSVSIEDLTDENSVILNDKDNEYVTNLMQTIEERIIEVNRVHMEKLGVSEDKNPIKYLIPSFLSSKNNAKQIDEEAVNVFNQKFELYESTNTKGATVKGLLTTIQNNNETEGNNKIEEINMDGEEYEVTEQNITFLKSNINVEDAYRVEFEKDSSTGLIYRAVINKR